jgi:hypothetical protein
LEPNPRDGHTRTDFENLAAILDVVATVIFTVEALLRIHAMTFTGYIKGGFNQLDLIVVITSWPSILVGSFDIDLGPLRAFRVLRVLKELRYLGALQAIMGCLSYNIRFISTLLSFILFFIVVRERAMLCAVCLVQSGLTCAAADVWCVRLGAIHGKVPRSLCIRFVTFT